MDKGYMKQIATMLDVKLGEEFMIEDTEGIFKFEENYLFKQDGKNKENWIGADHPLLALISGQKKIVKMPWKPHDGDNFFYITIFGNIERKSYVKNIPYDCTLIRMGNCFKTREEAEEHKEEWLKYFWQEPDLSWRTSNEQ